MVSLPQGIIEKESFDEKTHYLKLIQTHISWVFLTGNFVYKIKKPVNFGFLDFSTLERRKHFCEREFRINSRFSPELYIGVLPVTREESNLKINGSGEIVDYCIKMREIPQEKLMSNLLEENHIIPETIEKISDKLMAYYSGAAGGPKIDKFGKRKIIKENWDENFEQTKPFIGITINDEDFRFIKEKIGRFISLNNDLFNDRIKRGKIRWCHGDLHSGNIFIDEPEIHIFDAIEFNSRFACSDIASDIAFLAMDLEHRGYNDLSHHLLDYFILASGDEQINEVIDFYKCYRAYVRGKVISFKLNDHSIPEDEKQSSIKEAHSYFAFSRQYAKRL